MDVSVQEQILKALNWRYAVKKFDPTKKISDEDWQVLEESLRLAPSSYGLQPWKFFVIQNVELREKLRAVSWNQSQVTDCSHYIVFTTLKKMDADYIQKYLDKIAEIRGINATTLEGFKKSMMADLVNGPRASVIQHWAQRQAYIAMGQVMETAALIQVDTCPMEGLDPAAYDKLLNLEASPYSTIAAVAVGYRHVEDIFQHSKKVRFDASDVIRFIK